ncbi:MAG: putative glycoside hydrolase [Solirubrobacterales bacterium]
MRRLSKIAILVTAAACLAAAAPAGAATTGPGKVNLIRNATSSFDPYLTGSTGAQRQWIADTYWRIRGYDPFFANVGATSWTGPAHYYEDLYAIYRDVPADQQLLAAHPDWVLRDAAGRALFIPYDCNGQTCTQYAADFGNPGYRSWWISRAQSTLAKGYEGIFIDDVNMEMRAGNESGQDVTPIDPRTGAAMTAASWRRYMAEFTEQIDAALDGYEIVHNTHWWVDHSDPYVQRQIDSADMIELERGYNDGGLVAGAGAWGFERLMAHVDWLHSRGKSAIFEPYNLNAAKQEYELAAHYLTKAASDAIASDFRADPGNFSDDWLTDLGAPLGARYRWNGLWRRDYANGIALVNQPGQPTRTAELEPYRTLAGQQVSSVTLGASRGAVLLGSTERDPTSISITAQALNRVKIAGRVKRARSGRVELRVMRGHKVVRSRRTTLSAKGRFAAEVGTLGGGRYRVEAVYPGSWDTKASSATRRFRLS